MPIHLSAIAGSDALAQQGAPTQQGTAAQDAPAQVPPRALEPDTGKPAEAMPAKAANGSRAVSTRQPGEALKIKLTNGSVMKGTFKRASDDGLVLELKNKEVSLSRDEIVSVAVLVHEEVKRAISSLDYFENLVRDRRVFSSSAHVAKDHSYMQISM